MAQNYREKNTIQAQQWDGTVESAEEILNWYAAARKDPDVKLSITRNAREILSITIGTYRLSKTEWLVKSRGDWYVNTDYQFKEIFEPAEMDAIVEEIVEESSTPRETPAQVRERLQKERNDTAPGY